MSELAIRGASMPAVMEDDPYARLAAWAASAKAAHEVATWLVQTSFVPESFRGKPMEATAAILSGGEVGLSPMASLRSFDVINNVAAPRAITLRAVVLSRGHEMKVVESTATRAVVEGRRRGEQAWQKSIWTMERAKQLGLTGKKNWLAQPGAMLVARATSEVARWIGADAIAGIPYSSEEIDDGDQMGFVPAAAEVAPKRTARRAPIAAVVGKLEPDPEPEFDEPAVQTDPAPDMMTKPQTGKMFALLKDRGYTDKDEMLVFIAGVIGREIQSRSELTRTEAGLVIDALEQPDAEPTLDEDWPDVAEPGA